MKQNSHPSLRSSPRSYHEAKRKFWNVEDTSTLTQLEERVGHMQRVADGLSDPRFVVPIHETFPHMYASYLGKFTREELRELEKEFLQADWDGDGALNKQETKYWLEKHVEPVTEVQLRSIFAQFDPDEDGSLSFQEFLNLVVKIGHKVKPTSSFQANLQHPVEVEYQEPTYGTTILTTVKGDRPEQAPEFCKTCIWPPASKNQNREKLERLQPIRSATLNPKNSNNRPEFANVPAPSPSETTRSVRQNVKYFEQKIESLIAEAETNRAQNQYLAQRKARSTPRSVIKPPETKAQSPNPAPAFAASDKPPPPPPLPLNPLFEPHASSIIPKVIHTNSNRSLSQHESNASLGINGNLDVEKKASSIKSQEPQLTRGNPEDVDKTDEFQILNKSTVSSSRSLTSQPFTEATIKESPVRLTTARDNSRFSDPTPSSAKEVPSYIKEGVVAGKRPLALIPSGENRSGVFYHADYQVPLEDIFDRRPKLVEQNFTFPNVYKGLKHGVKTRSAQFNLP